MNHVRLLKLVSIIMYCNIHLCYHIHKPHFLFTLICNIVQINLQSSRQSRSCCINVLYRVNKLQLIVVYLNIVTTRIHNLNRMGSIQKQKLLFYLQVYLIKNKLAYLNFSVCISVLTNYRFFFYLCSNVEYKM